MSFKEKIISAFNNRNFIQAFTGKNHLHVNDPTWGGHDYLLVFFHLINWIEGNRTQEVINEIEKSFHQIFINYRTISEINNGLESINIIRAYCIQAHDKNNWPIPKDFFIMLFINNIHNFNKDEIIKLNISRDIEGLRKYMPELPDVNLITSLTTK